MPQCHRQCSKCSYWLSQVIWTVPSQNSHQYMVINLKSVKWHFWLVSWIGHYGDQIVRNKQWDWAQTVQMTQIDYFFKCFGPVLARWCFEPGPAHRPKVALQPISSETAFSQNWAKTLKKIINLSQLNCLISLPMFISHYLVSIVPYSWNKPKVSFDTFEDYHEILVYILAGNCSYDLEELVGTFKALSMTL